MEEEQMATTFTGKDKQDRLHKLLRLISARAKTYGWDTIRKVTPEFFGHDSIAAMARDIGVNRADLSGCLGMANPRPFAKVKRKVEECGGLPTGSMEAVIERLTVAMIRVDESSQD